MISDFISFWSSGTSFSYILNIWFWANKKIDFYSCLFPYNTYLIFARRYLLWLHLILRNNSQTRLQMGGLPHILQLQFYCEFFTGSTFLASSLSRKLTQDFSMMDIDAIVLTIQFWSVIWTAISWNWEYSVDVVLRRRMPFRIQF